MKDNLLMGLVVVTVIVAVVAAGFTYYTITDLSTRISGYVSQDTAVANITIESLAIINFTVDSINWGSGRVNLGQSHAHLSTVDGTVANGNWTSISQGLVLENIGNANVSIELQGGNATGFIGGTGPGYWWNITNSEAGSCQNTTGFNLGAFYDVNSSTTVCDVFGFVDANDEITIDINLTVPYDSLTGERTDTITAVGTAV